MKYRYLSFILLILLFILGCNTISDGIRPHESINTLHKTERESIEDATALAIQALEHYDIADYEKARQYFDAAIAGINQCDLPDGLKTLDLLELNLPSDLREKYSLKTVYDESSHRHPEEEAGLKGGNNSNGLHASGESAANLATRVPVHINDDDFIRQEILRLLREFGEDQPNSEEIENLLVKVKSSIKVYQTTYRDIFVRSLIRGQKYYPMIYHVFGTKKVPLDLANMALVESAFVYRAHSRARARGIWQFIAPTARIYGLQVGYYVDERLDPVKSTIAAREYLLDLIGIFGSRSFLLALAAYNAGEGKVQSCLRKLDDPFENRTFWHINACLRAETRNYIPRILAATIIQKDLKRFGFVDIEFPDADVFIVPSPTKISEIARLCGVSKEKIYKLNIDLSPSYRSTPTTNFILYVPRDSLPKLQSKYGKVDVTKVSLVATTRSAPGSVIYHRVRRGQTLSGISRKYRVSISSLKRWNGLKRDLIRVGQKLVIYPRGSSPPAKTAKASVKSSPAKTSSKITYRVKKGNSLSSIAGIFSVSFRDIMKWNGLSRGRIYPGQKLTIYTKKPYKVIYHKVAAGQTAAQIASRYGISLKALVTANGLSRSARIKKNQTLIVYRRK
jgi:membrane-bound lytic murein transglycosylase D